MAIFARPADTRPGPTLMGRILPGPFRNRVGYGFKKKNPKRVRVLLKNPDPTRDPTRIKTRIKPGTQNYKNTLIYIYSYNLTLTNPSFFNLQSSAAAQHSPQNSVPPSFLHSPLSSFSSVHAVINPISAVTPHALRLPLSLPVTPSPISTTRSAQSDQLSLISTVTPVTLSLSLF